MATVGIKIFKHHKKTDGTYNVKIRVTHNGANHYLDTAHFVSDKQLRKDYSIKDVFLNRILNGILDDYRAAIDKLHEKLDLFSSESLRNYLRDKDEPVDFIKFSINYINELKKVGRNGSAKTLQTVQLALVDFFNKDTVLVNEINVSMLNSYEKHLRKERTITRLNQFGKPLTRKVKGMRDAGIHNHMRDLRILFKAAMAHFNKPEIDIIRITHYPFEKYKIIDAPITRKRNLKAADIVLIRHCNVGIGSRAELARDLFMLSFLLCGTNAVDLYYLTEKNINNGRLEYNRRKTSGRRKDNAFISINITNDAKPLLDKYLGKLQLRYASPSNLDHAINIGMKEICKLLSFSGITFYWARHSFANLARNQCRFNKDDVALALNHIDGEHKTTDIYLEKDWVIVDEVQNAVTNLIFKPTKEEHISTFPSYQVKVKDIISSITLIPLQCSTD